MLRRLRLVNYRAFRDFTVTFPPSARLVGPNSAGKSTVLTALRVADAFLRVAHARKPDRRFVDHERGYNAYTISLSDFPSLQESLRHEFRPAEVRLELTWNTQNALVAVWPEPDEYDDVPFGYFYLRLRDGGQPSGTAAVRLAFPRLGIIPIMAPLENTEQVLTEEYVRRNVSTPLASRHFRNHLRLLQAARELDSFIAFATPWLPGIAIEGLESHGSDQGPNLDLYISEQGSRVPKEVIWAGDGIQIWLQILFHLYRLRNDEVVVLDEPDVYLHADLQRRLVHLLESSSSQTIVATHSAEIIAESPKSSVVWIDRSRKRATAVADEALLQKLSDSLGSQFNLKLARAMRSRVLLLVEGEDMQILRRLGKTLELQRLVHEDGIAIVQLQGYSKNDQVDSLKWIVKDFLEDAVACRVILDRDYRSNAAVERVVSRLAAIGVNAHVWRRKELESYLLEPASLSRASGADEPWIRASLGDIYADMEEDVFSQMLEERQREQVDRQHSREPITAKFTREFKLCWQKEDWRAAVVPPKAALARLNERLQLARLRPVSFERLSAVMTVDEIPVEMKRVLHDTERAASGEDGT